MDIFFEETPNSVQNSKNVNKAAKKFIIFCNTMEISNYLYYKQNE